MKRIQAFLLLATLILTVFTSCSTEGPELLSFISEDSTFDLMGKEIRILQDPIEGNMIFNIRENTIMHEAVIARINDIEKNFNCTIIVEEGGNSNDMYEQRIMTDTMLGVPSGDILQGDRGSKMHYFSYNNMLYPLTEVKEYLDYENSEKFGVPGVLEAAMANGIPYAVQPNYWLGSQSNGCFVVAYNSEMLRSQGLTDLHEYYENETWTWDSFEQVLNDFDNSSSENLYAFAAPVRGTAQLALYANGVKFVEKIDNEYRCDILEPYSIRAVEWIQKLYIDYADKVKNVKDYWDVTDFVEKNSLMTIATGQQVSEGDVQYEADFEFGIMPFPSGPDGNYGEWAQWVETINGFAIPVHCNDPVVSAKIINELCEPLDNIGKTDDLKSYFNEMVFFSETDTQIYFEICEFTRYRYWRGKYKADQLAFEIGDSYANKTAIEMLQAHEPQMLLVIEDEIKPNYENYIFEHLYTE